VVVAVGQDIGALQGLVEVAKDVVDNDKGLGSIGRAGYV
jgi:hypothetical protein